MSLDVLANRDAARRAAVLDVLEVVHAAGDAGQARAAEIQNSFLTFFFVQYELSIVKHLLPHHAADE